MNINIFPATSDLATKVINHVERMKTENDKIILSTRNIAKLDESKHQIEYADYNNYESMLNAFKDTDTLFLIPSTTNPIYRVDEIRSAYQAAKDAGVKKVVLSSLLSSTSSFSVSPFLFYAERIAKSMGLDLIIIRNSLYIDPMLPYAEELAKSGILGYPAGSGKVSYMLKDEMAKATAKILTLNHHSKSNYYLTNQETVSMQELAQIMSEATNSKIKYQPMTNQEFIDHCIEYGDSKELAEILSTMYQAIAEEDFNQTSNDYYELLNEYPTSVKAAFLKEK